MPNHFKCEFRVREDNLHALREATSQYLLDSLVELETHLHEEKGDDPQKDIQISLQFTCVKQNEYSRISIDYDATHNQWISEPHFESASEFVTAFISSRLFSTAASFTELRTQLNIRGEDAEQFNLKKFILQSSAWQQLYPEYSFGLFRQAMADNDVETVRILFRNGFLDKECPLPDVMRVVTEEDIATLAHHKIAPLMLRHGLYRANETLVRTLLEAHPGLAAIKPTEAHLHQHVQHRNLLADGHQFPTPIEWAVGPQVGHRQDALSWIVPALKKSDLDLQNSSGQSALHIAWKWDETSLLKFPNFARILLTAGIDPNIQDNKHWTVLDYIIENFISKDRYHSDKLRNLIAELITKYNATGSADHMAQYNTYVLRKCSKLTREQADFLWDANGGDQRRVKAYLKAHPNDLEICTADGNTALHHAAFHGHAELVDALIEAGADVHAKGFNGGTPLIEACHCHRSSSSSYENYCRIVKSLIVAGADVNARKTQDLKQTALYNAVCSRDPLPEIVGMLLEAGADVKFKGSFGRGNLYQIAQEKGHHGVAILLKQALRIQDPELYIDEFKQAAHQGDLLSVKEYINTTLDENTSFSLEQVGSSSMKQTALHVAAGNNQMGVVTLLLKSGASIDPKDKNNYTPLLRAASNGHVDMINLLISFGADTEQVSIRNESVEYFVQKNGLDVPLLYFQTRLHNANQLSTKEEIETTPAYLVCPVSLDIFTSPITLSNGQTYERGSLLAYAKHTSGDTFACPLTRKIIHKNELNHGVNRTVKAIAKAFVISIERKVAGVSDVNAAEKPLNYLLCPLTRKLFNEPVTLSTGYTYERLALCELAGNKPSFTCPRSGIEISVKELERAHCQIIWTLSQNMHQYGHEDRSSMEPEGDRTGVVHRSHLAGAHVLFGRPNQKTTPDEQDTPPVYRV